MTVQVSVHGFVQGVGYRQFVKKEASKLQLTGYVKNRSDGNVEAVFQSMTGTEQEDKRNIDQMIALCHKGPFLAQVKEVIVASILDTTLYADFVMDSA